MKRVLLFIGLIYAGCFATPMAAAQDYYVSVDLFAMAHFPLVRQEKFLRYPAGPSEYKRLTRWNLDKWRDRSPEHFDLVAIVQNPGTIPVGPIELRLTRDVKIGELPDYDIPDSDPREHAQWEGPIPVETKTIGTLGADAATSVWFGPLSADELLEDLWEQDL